MINNTITTNFAPLLPQSEENKVGSTTDVNILLSLENSLIPDLLEKENEKKSFDQQNGLIDDNIYDLRYFGAHLIQVAGILLELPQVVMATGQVLYQRFFCKNSFIKHDFDIYAFASLYLAAKIEEHPKRLRVILVVSNHIVQLLANSKIKPLTIEVVHKNRLISAERKLLKDLGFCVHVKHPHKMIVLYLQFMNFARTSLLQKSWNYMNDALRTTLFVQFSPETIACGCIYLAARDQEKPLPDNPHWYYLYGASTKDVKSISIQLVKLYEREKPSYSSLIKLVKECKDKSVKRKIDSLTIGGSIDQLRYATEVSKHSIKNKHKHKSKTDSHSEHRHRDKHKNHVKSSKKSRSRENKNDYHSRRHKVYNRKRYHSSDDDSDHKMKMRSRSLKKISSRLDLHKISVKEETNNHYRNHKT